MKNQLELAIGSGTQNRQSSNDAECKDKIGSGTGSEPADDDRFRNRSIFRNRSSTEIVDGYDRFRNSTPTGESISGTGLSRQGSLTGERGFASLSPPVLTGDPGQEPIETSARPVFGSGTGPEPVADLNGPERSQQPRLRPYQADAIAAVEAEFARGVMRTLLVLPTGTGKTVVFAELARRDVDRDGRVLVLAHRTELLEQACKKLADVGVRASIEQGDRRAHASPVVVASVQTLRGPRLHRFAQDAFSLVIVDEAHHTAAASYSAILERFSRARVLGVTATPDRADGKALGKAYESVAFTYEMRRAIEDGYLAPIRARRIMVADLDLSAIKSHHGDFDQGELATLLTAEKALHGVVGPLVQLAGRRKTLVFGVDVAHAKALAAVLNRHTPGSAIALDGKSSAAERASVLELFRKGQFQFLVNCALFTEGFDEPSIECIAMARPTQSRALYCQMLGRGTRLYPGKPDCLALDFVGNSGRHRLIGPVDALAGFDLDEVAREKAEEILQSGQQELEAVLVAATAEAEALRNKAALIALTTYREKEVDVFLGDFIPPMDPNSPRWRDPATPAQLDALEKAGLGKPPPGLSKGEASQMLDAIAERARRGLATIPQCRLLEKLKLDTRNMTKARAAQLIAKARTANFQPWRLAHEPESRRGARRA